MGAEWEGRRFLSAWWTRARRLTQPYAAPAGRHPNADADTLEKHRAENRAPRPHFPRLSGSCAILSRKWGEEGAGVSGDAPPHFSPVRRAVTQPRWPRLTEPGRPRQTDAHLGPAAPSGPPSRMLPARPFPAPSRPVPSDCPTELRTSRLCQRSCPLRTRRGRGFDQAAPPYFAPHRRKCLPAGTSLTSQDSDVTVACLSARAWAEGGALRSSSTLNCGRRDIPARAARRHLGSRLLTARASLSNSLQSRPPTPGPAPGPQTPSPSAPPRAAVRGADAVQAPPSGTPVPGPHGLRWALAPQTLAPPPPPAVLTSSLKPRPASPGQPWLSIVTVGTGGNSLQPWSPRSTPTLPTTPEFCQPGFGQIQSKRRRGGDATSDVSAEVARDVLREAASWAAAHLPQAQKQDPRSV